MHAKANKLYMYISRYHVHMCIKVISILTILYLLIYITSLIYIYEHSHYHLPTKMRNEVDITMTKQWVLLYYLILPCIEYNTLYTYSSSKIVSNQKYLHILKTYALTKIKFDNTMLFKEPCKGKEQLIFHWYSCYIQFTFTSNLNTFDFGNVSG